MLVGEDAVLFSVRDAVFYDQIRVAVRDASTRLTVLILVSRHIVHHRNVVGRDVAVLWIVLSRAFRRGDFMGL